MSKLAKIPVQIIAGVTIAREGNAIKITGPKGTLVFAVPEGIDVEQIESRLEIKLSKDTEGDKKALLGLTRARIANMAKGVSSGFEKKLELSGVGYRGQASGNELILSVGFTHPVKILAPLGIGFAVADNIITISGIDKALVGDTAAKIRAIRPPEPYKGKGIKYQGEQIRRKAGKAVKALGAAK